MAISASDPTHGWAGVWILCKVWVCHPLPWAKANRAIVAALEKSIPCQNTLHNMRLQWLIMMGLINVVFKYTCVSYPFCILFPRINMIAWNIGTLSWKNVDFTHLSNVSCLSQRSPFLSQPVMEARLSTFVPTLWYQSLLRSWSS